MSCVSILSLSWFVDLFSYEEENLKSCIKPGFLKENPEMVARFHLRNHLLRTNPRRNSPLEAAPLGSTKHPKTTTLL